MVKYEQICFDQKTNQKNPMKAAKLLHKMPALISIKPV